MHPDRQLLDEIVIVGRTNLRDIDLPFNVKRIQSEAIFASNAQNTADVLQSTGATYVQKSQMGGGSPNIRGFEANKLLLVIDGVRMNNAIYRNGHLQNAITVDPAILEQMEIIYGPASLMYGSEALGGVIHFRSQSPGLASEGSPSHGLSAYTRYSSANQEKTIHFHHRFSGKKYGVISGATFSDYSDLRSGKNHNDNYPQFGLRPDYITSLNGQDTIINNSNPYKQIGTGYRQADLFQFR
jgi:hemoglobin/transferrin/lactoferrin receptor protein